MRSEIESGPVDSHRIGNTTGSTLDNTSGNTQGDIAVNTTGDTQADISVYTTGNTQGTINTAGNTVQERRSKPAEDRQHGGGGEGEGGESAMSVKGIRMTRKL